MKSSLRKVRDWLPDWSATLGEHNAATAGLVDVLDAEVDSAPDAVALVNARLDNMARWLHGIRPRLPMEHCLPAIPSPGERMAALIAEDTRWINENKPRVDELCERLRDAGVTPSDTRFARRDDPELAIGVYGGRKAASRIAEVFGVTPTWTPPSPVYMHRRWVHFTVDIDGIRVHGSDYADSTYYP